MFVDCWRYARDLHGRDGGRPIINAPRSFSPEEAFETLDNVFLRYVVHSCARISSHCRQSEYTTLGIMVTAHLPSGRATRQVLLPSIERCFHVSVFYKFNFVDVPAFTFGDESGPIGEPLFPNCQAIIAIVLFEPITNKRLQPLSITNAVYDDEAQIKGFTEELRTLIGQRLFEILDAESPAQRKAILAPQKEKTPEAKEDFRWRKNSPNFESQARGTTILAVVRDVPAYQLRQAERKRVIQVQLFKVYMYVSKASTFIDASSEIA
ncbi:uncharacterized protein BT62DRAFT_1012911 [Guyanagaster necrorhizus]|uniref:Uncharacterized protein n=1 Tax=Guyanagaster necrorhizus TaxID=856835 RepID=A0A9P8ALI9_9AGAR|nr:uncharacterized protein BT62DRAFT_1012911 [Guyanagaster necrorhizus MCA 3950]KAG7440253.1 hypothetical protein BT62DRAFT_1012911 [Guyanagaster necrorhizus MCA 3950]